MTKEQDTFWDIISAIPICMVTTTDGSVIRARPMAPFISKLDRTIQFVTDDDSAKVDEMIADRDICLSFADQKAMQFVSVSGRATMSDDRKLIDELWGPYCETFFPGGPESVVAITVTPTQAEYWDNNTNSLRMAAEVTKAFFSDDGPNLGDNAKLSF